MSVVAESSVSKLLFTRRESAYALGLSVRSVDFAIASGDLKVRKIGRKVLVPAKALAAYANADHKYLTLAKEDAN